MKKLLICFSVLLVSCMAVAQQKKPLIDKGFGKRQLSFIENKGQIIDQYGATRRDIKYKTGGSGVTVFVGNGQLHYQFCKRVGNGQRIDTSMPLSQYPALSHKIPQGASIEQNKDTAQIRYQMYRLDMTLEGANPNATPIAEDKQAYYENYHTAVLTTDSSVVATYGKVTYPNIYPHIDWVLYIKNNQLEYDFIVNPGGNIDDIKIHYSGANDITYNAGNINITTPMGSITEQQLYAYMGNTKTPLPIAYTQKGNTIGFALRTHQPPHTTYTIDPKLAWATYFGGDGEDNNYGMACDKAGNSFLGGTTTSTNNVATTGSYQTEYGGQVDCLITAFSPAGNLLWSTYYGGNNQDYAYAIACDNLGSVYITGTTLSPNNIATPSSFETVYIAGYYAFVAKFNYTGNIEWGTYFGMGHGDEGRAISCDLAGNVYICGQTGSDSIIATPGCYQDTLGGGGYLSKFNKDGKYVWGTYFVTTWSTALASTCDNNNNIYIGGTVYKNGIIPTPYCYQDSSGGGWDCFIAKFDSAGALLWSTYYGGDSGESINAMVCDDANNLYIAGGTFSRNGIATVGANQAVYGGGYEDGFVAKFNDTGAMQWATYYGGLYVDEAIAITCDHKSNVYITGYTVSPNNIATAGSLNSASLGSYDAFFAKFNEYGSLLYGTYFGGNAGDIGSGVGCDSIGNIYLSGGTASRYNITTYGCYQYFFADSSDIFLAKFDSGATGIAIVNESLNAVHITPNPNNGIFSIIGYYSPLNDVVGIDIINTLGQSVYTAQTKRSNGKLNYMVTMQQPPKGMYFMKLTTNNATKIIQFTIY